MKRKQIAIFFCVVLAFLVNMFLLRHLNAFETSGDTEVYRTSIETWGGWKEWASAYYHNNSGRVLIHAILIVIVNMPVIVYKLLASGMIALTCFMLYKYACSGKYHTTPTWKLLAVFSSAIICYFFIPSSVLGSSTRWVPGALNYLFPVAAMLVSLYPFYLVLNGRQIPLICKISSALFICLCANMEQASAVYLVIGFLVLLYVYIIQKRHIPRRDLFFVIALEVVCLAVFLISYFAPGNVDRYMVEKMGFAGYDMNTFVDKLVLGFQVLWLYLNSPVGLIIWLLPAGVFALRCLLQKSWKKMLLPCVFGVLSVIQNMIVRNVFDMESLQPIRLSYVLWLGFSVGMVCLNGYIILLSFTREEEKLWNVLLYYGALVAGIVVAMSPTLYVSAARTMYITFTMYCLVTVNIISEGLIHGKTVAKPQKSVIHRLNAAIAMVCPILVVVAFCVSSFQTKEIDATGIRCNTAYQIENVQFCDKTNTMSAIIDVVPFEYTANNWCQGMVDGYDINVQLGIMDLSNDTIKIHRTYINTIWPVMATYPEDKAEIIGHFYDGLQISEGKVPVAVCTTHDGDIYYTPLEITY